MHLTTLPQHPITMSSREIAELTGKEHRHVLRDIERLFVELDIAEEGYAQEWTHPQNGQNYREFVLPKNLTLNLIAGYSAKLREAIIDRWLELEAQVAPPAAVTASVTALIDIPTPDELRAAAAIFARADTARQAIQAEMARLASHLDALGGAAPSADGAQAAAMLQADSTPVIVSSAHGRELDLFGQPIPADLRLVSGYDLSDMSGIHYSHMMARLKRAGVYDPTRRFPMPSGRGRKVLSSFGRKIAVQSQSGIIKWKLREALAFLGKKIPADRLH